jgi:hypothetical protein
VRFVVDVLCDIHTLIQDIKFDFFDSLLLNHYRAATMWAFCTSCAVQVHYVVCAILEVDIGELIVVAKCILVKVHQIRAFNWVTEHVTDHEGIKAFVRCFKQGSSSDYKYKMDSKVMTYFCGTYEGC